MPAAAAPGATARGQPCGPGRRLGGEPRGAAAGAPRARRGLAGSEHVKPDVDAAPRGHRQEAPDKHLADGGPAAALRGLQDGGVKQPVGHHVADERPRGRREQHPGVEGRLHGGHHGAEEGPRGERLAVEAAAVVVAAGGGCLLPRAARGGRGASGREERGGRGHGGGQQEAKPAARRCRPQNRGSPGLAVGSSRSPDRWRSASIGLRQQALGPRACPRLFSVSVRSAGPGSGSHAPTSNVFVSQKTS
mmetsp:Transcript_7583/g.18207  ORF Transcript_7583/g.18207 Transcript_7583/m.18207 type:complete len:248 (-) Transcript_7583:279-1022(-)